MTGPPAGLRFLPTQRAFVIGLLVLFAAVSVQYAVKVLKPRDGAQTRSAIVRWRAQLQELDSGENIYERYAYPNPPVMALLLRPIAALPPLAGALTWYYLKVGMALLSFAAVFRLIETPEQPFPPWAKALTVLLSLNPVVGDLQHGNVNLFILFLVVSALYAYRRGWDVTAGVVLGLAIACKVTPALFVFYFLWKRAWKVAAGCALGLALFLGPVPALFLGWQDNAEHLSSWFSKMVVPYVFEGVVTPEHQNQSLPGLLVRLLTPSPSFVTYVNDVYTPTAYHNLAAWDVRYVALLVKGCMAAFAAVVVWSCRTPTLPRGGWRLGAETALIVVGMLLFSERTWKHHCVTLVLPFAVLSYSLATFAAHRAVRNYLAVTLAAALLLMGAASTSVWPDDGGAKLAQVYGTYVAAFVVLATALVVVLRSGRRNEAPAGDAAAPIARSARDAA